MRATAEPAPIQPTLPRSSLPALFARFLRFGALAWGGPVAQIEMIRAELVDEQRWVEPDRFRRALAVYQALPGPEAHELCVWFGMVARGRTGALLAGLGFMLPGFVLMVALSALYWEGHLRTGALSPLFVGMQAAVVAVIARALCRMAQHLLVDGRSVAIALAACGATLVGVPFWFALLFGGGFDVLGRPGRWPFAVALALAFAAASVWLPVVGTPAVADLPPASQPSPFVLFLSGLRTGLLTFGGAYAAIPLLQHDAVATGNWLTDAQFLDGVALAGILPAPLIIFATFVGYGAGGLSGALAVTAGVFLPAFALTMLGHAFFERICARPTVRGFLDGVTAAAIGIMAAATIGLARSGLGSPVPAGFAVVAFLLLWSWKGRAAVPTVVLAAGLAGLAVGAA